MADPTLESELPVTSVLPDILAKLSVHDALVLQAPPGAGKTTLVPLALMDTDWLSGQRILLLEPRRIAARNAAHRMASMLGEPVGETVGYRMRLDTRVGPNTIVEVITEGILTRMLLSDPSLDGVGLVIFDEFHERNLDSDLGLALVQQGRTLFRETGPPLKLMVMSATLEENRIAEMLQAPIIKSEGRQFPVETHYTGASKPRERIADRVVSTVLRAVDTHTDSNLLVFLPGQGEIHNVADQLAEKMRDPHVIVHPLYGNLSIEAQQRAISPEQGGQRKIVLATNIAETSLTIEGVDVVVDSGLAREPLFDPNTAMTRLQTRKISRASADQRRGRAGRLRAGHCYRLWSKDQQQQLAVHGTPEMLQADLSPLALQLCQWGVMDPAELLWLDPPPAGAWRQAIELLESLGAVTTKDGTAGITGNGELMARIPAHPRLAHMLLCAAGDRRLTELATDLAAILSDRDPFTRDNPDMGYRVELLEGSETCPPRHRGWLNRMRQLAEQFRSSLYSLGFDGDTVAFLKDDEAIGYLIATAYPDRVARKRHGSGYQLANGRSVSFSKPHRLTRNRWLAVAETGGMSKQKGDVINSAAKLNPELFDSMLSSLVREETVAEWQARSGGFTAERHRCIGRLVLKKEKIEVDATIRRGAIIEQIRRRGLQVFNWTDSAHQWQARVQLLHNTLHGQWPDVGDEALLADVENWLGSSLDDIQREADFRKLDLLAKLRSLLPWSLHDQLEALAPERLAVPSGSDIRIDYTADPPVLAVKLQEMFGVTETPRVANGAVPVVVHLLSPAGRPLQITQDLAAFWLNGYQEVKKEMKGRYPKHPWPDDPIQATPTRRTKKRSGDQEP